MMGKRQVDQGALFYEFSVEKHVPVDHMLRSIDRFVDLGDVRRYLAPFYSTTGRPSVNPELLIGMLIIGYGYGIRSERRLCEEVHLNLGYRWFCRLCLAGEVPDHSTFSKNRHGRFRESDLLRQVFETVLRRCLEEGLVGGDGFAVDGSLIKADASRQKGVEGAKGLAPEVSGRAVDEYLAVLDDAAFGAATEVKPKFISPADPAARWTGANGGQAFFAYAANYLVDLDHGIVVDVEATTAIRQAEVTAAKRMIERTIDRFDLYPARPAGDSAYGSAEMLRWLVYEHGIEPHVTVFDKSARRNGTLSREDFAYDRERDVYVCPAGKTLTTRSTLVNDGATLLYRASKFACYACALKPAAAPRNPRARCRTPSSRGRGTWPATSGKATPAAPHGGSARKVEILFAHLKRILRVDRLRLRGPNGARDEFLLAATAQNLRKLAKLIIQRTPLPAT
jgi:transposase